MTARRLLLVGLLALGGLCIRPERASEATLPPASSPPDSTLAPDAPTLALWSEAAGVPALVTVTVAWTESGRNLDPTLRGAAGEVGRFQIRPSTARERCPRQNIDTYHGNLVCFLRLMRENYATCREWRCALAAYNGRGPAAAAYAARVFALVRQRVLAEVEP
jgi:hypothetical protein